MLTKNFKKASLPTAGLAACVLLLGSGAALAQNVVNLTASPSSVTLPDGSTVPMWGYSCHGAAAATALAPAPTCRALNPAANSTPANTTVTTPWSPVVITVPTGSTGTASLTINLTNTLSFTPSSGSATTP